MRTLNKILYEEFYFKIKDTRILFLVKHTLKMDIIRYYLLPNSPVLKLCNKKCIFSSPKYVHLKFLGNSSFAN